VVQFCFIPNVELRWEDRNLLTLQTAGLFSRASLHSLILSCSCQEIAVSHCAPGGRRPRQVARAVVERRQSWPVDGRAELRHVNRGNVRRPRAQHLGETSPGRESPMIAPL
jgi:hypothetical protein